MELHREEGPILVVEAFERAVVQIAEVGLDHIRVERLGVDRVAVVLNGDLDLPGLAVLVWVVAAVVPELEFVGATTERGREDLAAQADSELRLLPLELAHGRDR